MGSKPTDNWRLSLEKIKGNQWFRMADRFGVGVGKSVDYNTLKALCGYRENVFSAEQFGSHFALNWIKELRVETNSASTKTSKTMALFSAKVNSTGDTTVLSKAEICRVCDKMLPSSAVYCPYCGTRVTIEKPAVRLTQVDFSVIAPKKI